MNELQECPLIGGEKYGWPFALCQGINLCSLVLGSLNLSWHLSGWRGRRRKTKASKNAKELGQIVK
jgi:hypothetical protein